MGTKPATSELEYYLDIINLQNKVISGIQSKNFLQMTNAQALLDQYKKMHPNDYVLERNQRRKDVKAQITVLVKSLNELLDKYQV